MSRPEGRLSAQIAVSGRLVVRAFRPGHGAIRPSLYVRQALYEGAQVVGGLEGTALAVAQLRVEPVRSGLALEARALV